MWANFAFASGLFAAIASGTNIFHIGARRATELPIAVPPLEEQRRIVDFTDAVGGLDTLAIAAAKACHALLLQLTESVFTRLSQDVDHRPIGQLVRRERRPVGVQSGHSYRETAIVLDGKGIFHKEPVLGSDIGSKKLFWVQPGDLVFNIVFAWEGATAIVSDAERDMCGSHRFPTYRGVAEGVVPYLRHFFRTRRGQRMLADASPGSAGRNRTLNQSVLLSFLAPVPSCADMQSAVRLLDAAERLAADAHSYRTAVTSLRHSLLSDLLAGEHEIPESYDALLEPA